MNEPELECLRTLVGQTNVFFEWAKGRNPFPQKNGNHGHCDLVDQIVGKKALYRCATIAVNMLDAFSGESFQKRAWLL